MSRPEKSLQGYISENGAINNIDDFNSYLNYVAEKITDYEGLSDLNGLDIEFTKDTKGVSELYNRYNELKAKQQK